MNKVAEHYRELAKMFGASKQLSMLDITTRDKEVELVLKTLKMYTTSQFRLLDVGCGNGYTLKQLRSNLTMNAVGIDTCKELLHIAEGRKLKGVSFRLDDVTKLKFNSQEFDTALSERCLINLPSWSSQKRALKEIHRVLKPYGNYLMIETFTDGQEEMNEARQELGLSPIPVPEYNVQFSKEHLLKFLEGKFNILWHSNFLSSYYYGSRILYPALLNNRGHVKYNTRFVQMFKYLPPFGNYSPIQAYFMEKIA